MTLKALLPLILQLSIALIVFGIALHSTMRDIADLFQKPGLFLRSMLAMFVVMPLFAIALAKLFNFDHALEVALVSLAISPVPPILPNKVIKAGGTVSYILGLLVFASLVSIVLVPLAVHLVGLAFGRDLSVPASVVAKVVTVSVLAPLVAGVIVKHLAPAF